MWTRILGSQPWPLATKGPCLGSRSMVQAAAPAAWLAARVLSARPKPRSRRGVPPCRGDPTRGIEPRTPIAGAAGTTTIGRKARSPRARPRHPMGSRGKLRPSGQPREGGQTAARGRRGSLLTRRLWRKSCRLRVRPLLWCSRSRGRPFSHALADRWARTPGSQMRPGRMLQGTG